MSVRLQNTNPITTADSLITIAGLPNYWSEFSGVKETISRPTYSDGLSNVKRKAASGSTEYADITISKAFDPEQDDTILTWIKEAKASLDTFDVTVRPVRRANGIEQRGTKAWSLSGCRVKEYEVMSGMDTAAGDQVAKLTVTLTVESASWA
ncbi:hypothetical protein [Pseudanabaena sp. FACHB-2040]|uniref:hypothetical protein n=1 Tax=Pseudanabaena sp. FACHB-2040 TaxID=2692859 RepID=UPI001683155E|nr:hypothetical protein [Pseudanabaena sp. FACHB-2040]MBD2256654.1 hypothetical protein [Pseudanabaena sp. FACHB-2040]